MANGRPNRACSTYELNSTHLNIFAARTRVASEVLSKTDRVCRMSFLNEREG